MFHFLKPTQEIGQNEVAALRFGIADAFMMYIKELWRNSSETAENRHVPLIFFLSPNRTFLNHLRPIYIFIHKIPLFLHLILVGLK